MKFEFHCERQDGSEIELESTQLKQFHGKHNLSKSDLLFGLYCPDAPRLAMIGATIDNHNLTGVGLHWNSAAMRLLGEAAELKAVHALRQGTGATHATDLVSGLTTEVPITTVMHKNLPISMGCGAGLSQEQAVVHATLELIERDATARWWSADLKGHRIIAERKFVNQYRDNNFDQRETCLIDVRNVSGISTVVALSWDRDGRMFSCGAAADTSVRRGAKRALRELHQMETGHHLIRQKIAAGLANRLSNGERDTILRATKIDCRALVEESTKGFVALPDEDVAVLPKLSELGQALANAQIEVKIVSLGQVFGLEVTKAISTKMSEFYIAHTGINERDHKSRGLRSAQSLPLM